jgi:hypothetical protein
MKEKQQQDVDTGDLLIESPLHGQVNEDDQHQRRIAA